MRLYGTNTIPAYLNINPVLDATKLKTHSTCSKWYKTCAECGKEICFSGAWSLWGYKYRNPKTFVYFCTERCMRIFKAKKGAIK